MSPRNLAWILGLALLSAPAEAHTVKISGDVAATFHVEPNHTPRAGQPARAWAALTRRGGRLIPLERCNCTLTVLDERSRPVLRPKLQAIDAEIYRGIPGADITFPRPGLYTLELRGSPKTEGDFQPFKLTYKVTVGR